MKISALHILSILFISFSLLSCTKQDPTTPDDGNNNSVLSGKVIYNFGINEKDTNLIIYAYDLKSGSQLPLVSGNVYCFSKPEKNKAVYLRSYFNTELKKRLSQIEIYDFLTNKSEIVHSTESNPAKNIFRSYQYVTLTPDAKSIVYVIDSTNTNATLLQNKKLVVRSLGSNSTIVLAEEVATEQHFKISPDGKYIVYFGGEGSSSYGKDELYISSLNGTFTKKLDIDTKYMYDFGTWFEWSPDGKYLMAVNVKRDKIILVGTNTWSIEKEIDCASTGGAVFSPVFADNSSIAFISTKRENQITKTRLLLYSLQDNSFSTLIENNDTELFLKLNTNSREGTCIFSTVTAKPTELDIYINNTIHLFDIKDRSRKKIIEKSSFDFFLF